MARVETFESGEYASRWSTSQGSSFEVQRHTVHENSYSLEGEVSSGNNIAISQSGSNLSPTTMKASFRVSSNASGDKLFVEWKKDGTVVNQLVVDSNGIKLNGTVLISSVSVNTWYTVELRNVNWSDDQVDDIYVNGMSEASDVAFSNSADNFNEVDLRCESGGSMYGYWDDVTIAEGDANYESWFDSVSVEENYFNYEKKKQLKVTSPDSQTVDIIEDNTTTVDDNNDSRYTFTAEAATIPSSLTVYIEDSDSAASMNVRLYKNGNKVYDELKDKPGNTTVTWNFDISNISAIWESGDTIGFEIDADTSEEPRLSYHGIEQDPATFSGPLVSKNDNSETWSSGSDSSELTMKAVPTQDKAQAIILTSPFDTFESGESQLNWESTSGFTVDSNSEIEGSNSLQINSNNEIIDATNILQQSISEDGKSFKSKIKIESKQAGDETGFVFFNSSGQKITDVIFEGDDSISTDSAGGRTSGTTNWNENQIYDVEVIFDFTNNTFEVFIDGNNEFGDLEFDFVNDSNSFNDLRLFHDTTSSTFNYSAFFDNQTYSNIDENTTGTGNIVLDWKNISSESDIAIYDQDGNLLPYEIESFDAAAGTATLWCYNSWTRDDTVQADILYGSSPTASEEDVENTWNNPGQNAELVAHHQEFFEDSTGVYEGSERGTSATDADIGGGLLYEASNGDYVALDKFYDTQGAIDETTVVAYAKSSNSSDAQLISSFDRNEYWRLAFSYNTSIGNVGWNTADTNGIDDLISSTSVDDGEYHQVVGWFDNDSSGDNKRIYIDSNKDTGNNAHSGNAVGTGTTRYGFVGNGSEASSQDGSKGPTNYMDGVIDDFRIYSDAKSDAWIQADYDASPKGGQTFFSQGEVAYIENGVETLSHNTNIAREFNISRVENATLDSLEAVAKAEVLEERIDLTDSIQAGFLKFLSENVSVSSLKSSTVLKGLFEGFNLNSQSDLERIITESLTEGLNVSTAASAQDFLRGQVTLKGAPVEGAEVYAYNKNTGEVADVSFTNENGNYQLEVPVGDIYLVAVDHEEAGVFYGEEKSINYSNPPPGG